MSRSTLRIATRGSRLALAQARQTADALKRLNPELEVDLCIFRTSGDQKANVPLEQFAGQGAFTREIEAALLRGEADAAVHSLKDLPTEPREGLVIAAIPAREDPHDVFIAARPMDWRRLGPESPIGASSSRRRAQLLRANPRLTVEPIRGNVPTRIEKMMAGQFAGIVLARAGLNRLQLAPPFVEEFSFEDMLPAAGQGALGIQARANDREILQLLQSLNDPETAAACAAEREFLRAMGGGCRLPIAAHARICDNLLILEGLVISADGERCVRGTYEGLLDEADQAGWRLAEVLLEQGAESLIRPETNHSSAPEPPPTLDAQSAVNVQSTPNAQSPPELISDGKAGSAYPLAGKRILVTRNEDSDGPLSQALAALGALPVCIPLVDHAPPEDPAPLLAAAREADSFNWIALTSARGGRGLRPGACGLRAIDGGPSPGDCLCGPGDGSKSQ